MTNWMNFQDAREKEYQELLLELTDKLTIVNEIITNLTIFMLSIPTIRKNNKPPLVVY